VEIVIAGVVVGMLTSDYKIDMTRMAIVRTISHPMLLTFHRAFDICVTDVAEAVKQVIALGCDRLLTSGRAPSAEAGLENLRTILATRDEYNTVHPCSRYLSVIAAAGVSAENAGAIVGMTGVDGVHAASSVMRKRKTAPLPPVTSRTGARASHEVQEEGYDTCEGIPSRGIRGDVMVELCEDISLGSADDDTEVQFAVGVTDFDDLSSSGVVCADEVSRLVDSAEDAWELLAQDDN
jgi:hypothetical protein